MFRYLPRPALRKTVLVLDALEDRYAPAAISILGSAAVDVMPVAPRVAMIDAAPAARIIESAVAVAPAQVDVVGFGFLHPFAQNGFLSSGDAFEAPAPPRPAPVQPPALPVTVLPQLFQESQIEEAPAVVQPAALSIPGPLPTRMNAAPVLNPTPSAPRVEQTPAEPTAASPTTFNAGEESTSRVSRPVVATMGMMAAGFLYVGVPLRREENFTTP